MSYRNLEIYQLAKEIAIEIHFMTLNELPKFEMYETGSQIRRSSKSVKSNIVEGYGRRSYKMKYIRFLIIAIASNDETIDHLETLYQTGSLKGKVKYESLFARLNILGKKLNKFIQSVQKFSNKNESNTMSENKPHPSTQHPAPRTQHPATPPALKNNFGGQAATSDQNPAPSPQYPVPRCHWAGSDPLNIKYHDEEWGVPVHNDRLLFEFLILEGAQAGLSWITILKKRKNYKKAFDNFNAKKIAQYDAKKVKELLNNEGIVRNRLKINASIINAKAFLEVKKEFDTFDKYIWQFVGGKPIINKFKSLKEIPAKTEISDAMSKDLKKRGFKFVGSTICYAFMQAVGMVNDHETSCFRYKELK